MEELGVLAVLIAALGHADGPHALVVALLVRRRGVADAAAERRFPERVALGAALAVPVGREAELLDRAHDAEQVVERANEEVVHVVLKVVEDHLVNLDGNELERVEAFLALLEPGALLVDDLEPGWLDLRNANTRELVMAREAPGVRAGRHARSRR